MLKKVGILANGGDVSGFNAVIRAIVKTAENHGVECYGIIDGYNGLIKKQFELLSTAEGGEAIRYITFRRLNNRFINKC